MTDTGGFVLSPLEKVAYDMAMQAQANAQREIQERFNVIARSISDRTGIPFERVRINGEMVVDAAMMSREEIQEVTNVVPIESGGAMHPEED